MNNLIYSDHLHCKHSLTLLGKNWSWCCTLLDATILKGVVSQVQWVWAASNLQHWLISWAFISWDYGPMLGFWLVLLDIHVKIGKKIILLFSPLWNYNYTFTVINNKNINIWQHFNTLLLYAWTLVFRVISKVYV